MPGTAGHVANNARQLAPVVPGRSQPQPEGRTHRWEKKRDNSDTGVTHTHDSKIPCQPKVSNEVVDKEIKMLISPDSRRTD